MSLRPRPLRVALLGLGNVGREVARGLIESRSRLRERSGGREIELAAVGVREPARGRGIDLPAGVPLSDRLEELVGDPSIDLVVELLGGLEPAGSLIRAALERGASVVTANKALLARSGCELESTARQRSGALRFEAAVGGGIPVLGPLASDLAAASVSSVVGIVNGTTNYILGQIVQQAQPYDVVLREAQALGYAEADPRADVEGDDATDKLVVLSRLAFGGWLDRDAVSRRLPTVRGEASPGIVSVRPEELEAAGVLDARLKLLAVARRGPSNGSIEASVVLTAVPAGSALAGTDGARNRIEIEAEPLGTVGFDGPGAGGAPTSSAVLSDVLAISRGTGSTWAALPPPSPMAPAGKVLPGARLDRPRTWFAYLPGVRAADVPGRLSSLVAEGPRGTAVMSRPVKVDELRVAFHEILAPDLDAGLYPVLEAP